MKKLVKGFTLIELLIVVAIIAILAAIAVPNFLEAQIRSKVSRVRADFRSLGTAIEAYRTDWNMYMPSGYCIKIPAGNPDYWQLLPPLTTPVAYISSTRAMKDPFADFRGSSDIYRTYRYINTWETWYQRVAPPSPPTPTGSYAVLNSRYMGGWLLQSFGPNKKLSGWGGTGSLAEPGGYLAEAGYGYYPMPYDATNGTVSAGDLMRSQKFPDGVPR